MLNMFKTKVKRPYFHQFLYEAESSVGPDFVNIEELDPWQGRCKTKFGKFATKNLPTCANCSLPVFVFFSQVLFRVEERKERRERREVNYWP